MNQRRERTIICTREDLRQGKHCRAMNFVSPDVVGRCVGLGVVSNVDTKEEIYTIVSPCPLEELRSVNCLSLGNVKVPEALVLEQGNENAPYVNFKSKLNPLAEPWQKSRKPKANFSRN